ncbi:MAG: carboxylate--amine ligase, partial [Clostridia bacterium]|nr:carboxylate--amine ligase [Clostridia bacterium]
VVHSNKTGEFQGLEIADDFEGEVIQLDLWAKPGDRVSEFTGANQTIGTLVLKFSSHEKAEADLLNVRDWVHVKVKELDDDRM